MPFIEAAVATAKELSSVPAGVYPLRVNDADVVPVKSNNPDGSKQQIACVITIEDQNFPTAAPVYIYLGLPHRGDDAKVMNRKLLTIARFCRQFNIPYEDNGFNTDDFPGSTCEEGRLEVEPVKDADGNETGETRNVLRLDRLPSEVAELTGQPGLGGRKRRRA